MSSTLGSAEQAAAAPQRPDAPDGDHEGAGPDQAAAEPPSSDGPASDGGKGVRVSVRLDPAIVARLKALGGQDPMPPKRAWSTVS